MSETRTLMFGDDLSPAADVAWLFINSQWWPGWRLEVVTAQLPETPGMVLPLEATRLHPWQPPRPRAAVPTAEFAEVVDLAAIGDPRVVLSQASDLLVIGPRGPGLLKALHLGSTADWLMRHPPAPLLIARHGQPAQRLVLCTDGSAHARAVTDVVAGLPWIERTLITVVAVDDGRIDPDAAIEDACRQLAPSGATVEVHLEHGSPTTALHAYLEATAPDLVALGTRGLTGLRRLRMGSTASAVARTAACSVLVACADRE